MSGYSEPDGFFYCSKMAEGKKSFILYVDQRGTFNKLSDEQAGKLIKHIFAYVSDEEQEELDEMFGSPSDYEDEELIDMTEWVKHGHYNKVKNEKLNS